MVMVMHGSTFHKAPGKINLGCGGDAAGAVYAYESGDGTHFHTSDGARVPAGDVAIERARPVKHVLQQHAVDAGARRSGRASTPAAPST